MDRDYIMIPFHTSAMTLEFHTFIVLCLTYPCKVSFANSPILADFDTACRRSKKFLFSFHCNVNMKCHLVWHIRVEMWNNYVMYRREDT